MTGFISKSIRISTLAALIIFIVCTNCFSAEEETNKTIYLSRNESFLATQSELLSLNNINMFENNTDTTYGTITVEVSINNTMQEVDVVGKASWSGDGDYKSDLTILVLDKEINPVLSNDIDLNGVIFIDQINPDENGDFSLHFCFNSTPIPGREYVIYFGSWKLENPHPVVFTYAPASLQEITVNNEVIEGFSFKKNMYEYTVPKGITNIPEIHAVGTDEEANITIVNANNVTGTASIEVKSRDNSESLTYYVKFNTDGNNSTSMTIENMHFSKGNNTWLSIPDTEEEYCLSVTLSEPVSGRAYAAFYDKNGKMKSIYVGKESQYADFILDFTVQIVPEITSYKIIIVDDNLAPYLEYPLTQTINMNGMTLQSFDNNKLTFCYYDSYYYITIAENVEVYVNGVLATGLSEELLSSADIIDFVSEERLGEYNRINIYTSEYGYLTGIISGEESNDFLKLMSKDGEQILQCEDVICFNSELHNIQYLHYLLSENGVFKKQLVKFGKNLNGNIDHLYTVTNEEPYSHIYLTFDGSVPYNKTAKMFETDYYTAASVSNKTIVYFVDSSGEQFAVKTIDDLNDGSFYKVAAYNASGKFKTAEAIVIYDLISIHPITPHTPTYIVESVSAVEGGKQITAYCVDSNLSSDIKEFYITGEYVYIYEGDVYRFEADEEGNVRNWQTVFSRGNIYTGSNPFGSASVGFGGSYGILESIDGEHISVYIKDPSSKIYSSNLDVRIFKKDGEGAINKTYIEQLEIGKKVLVIYYDGKVQAVYQIE